MKNIKQYVLEQASTSKGTQIRNSKTQNFSTPNNYQPQQTQQLEHQDNYKAITYPDLLSLARTLIKDPQKNAKEIVYLQSLQIQIEKQLDSQQSSKASNNSSKTQKIDLKVDQDELKKFCENSQSLKSALIIKQKSSFSPITKILQKQKIILKESQKQFYKIKENIVNSNTSTINSNTSNSKIHSSYSPTKLGNLIQGTKNNSILMQKKQQLTPTKDTKIRQSYSTSRDIINSQIKNLVSTKNITSNKSPIQKQQNNKNANNKINKDILKHISQDILQEDKKGNLLDKLTNLQTDQKQNDTDQQQQVNKTKDINNFYNLLKKFYLQKRKNSCENILILPDQVQQQPQQQNINKLDSSNQQQIIKPQIQLVKKAGPQEIQVLEIEQENLLEQVEVQEILCKNQQIIIQQIHQTNAHGNQNVNTTPPNNNTQEPQQITTQQIENKDLTEKNSPPQKLFRPFFKKLTLVDKDNEQLQTEQNENQNKKQNKLKELKSQLENKLNNVLNQQCQSINNIKKEQFPVDQAYEELYEYYLNYYVNLDPENPQNQQLARYYAQFYYDQKQNQQNNNTTQDNHTLENNTLKQIWMDKPTQSKNKTSKKTQQVLDFLD